MGRLSWVLLSHNRHTKEVILKSRNTRRNYQEVTKQSQLTSVFSFPHFTDKCHLLATISLNIELCFYSPFSPKSLPLFILYFFHLYFSSNVSVSSGISSWFWFLFQVFFVLSNIPWGRGQICCSRSRLWFFPIYLVD